MKRVIWFICLSMLACGPVTSAELDQGMDIDESGIESEVISGIIVDDTVTIIGRRFYEAFSLAWPDYKAGSRENLSIHEQPTARSGSRIWIEHNRVKLFEAFLSPAVAKIEATVRIAAQQVAEKLEEQQVEQLLFKNPDLGPDEI